MSQTPTCAWMDLSKNQRKAFESFGHVWTKLAQAQALLVKKATKGQVPLPVSAWLPAEFSAPDFYPGFVLLVEELTVPETSAPVYQWKAAISKSSDLAFWRQAYELSKPEGARLVEWKVVPELMNAPVWSALIRLHELKTFWVQELRQNHYDMLREWLPEAWLSLQEPLPPGATLSRLGKRSWAEVLASETQWVKRPALDADLVSPLALQDLSSGLTLGHVFQPDHEIARKQVALFFAHESGKTQLLGVLEAG